MTKSILSRPYIRKFESNIYKYASSAAKLPRSPKRPAAPRAPRGPSRPTPTKPDYSMSKAPQWMIDARKASPFNWDDGYRYTSPQADAAVSNFYKQWQDSNNWVKGLQKKVPFIPDSGGYMGVPQEQRDRISQQFDAESARRRQSIIRK